MSSQVAQATSWLETLDTTMLAVFAGGLIVGTILFVVVCYCCCCKKASSSRVQRRIANDLELQPQHVEQKDDAMARRISRPALDVEEVAPPPGAAPSPTAERVRRNTDVPQAAAPYYAYRIEQLPSYADVIAEEGELGG